MFLYDKLKAEHEEELAKYECRIEEMLKNERALEQGMDEMEEGYQQMILDYVDTITALTQAVDLLRAIVAEHNEKCLIELGRKNTG